MTYRRMIEDLDQQVGRVLDALQAGGMADNTSVIFTSDNGGERFADTWPFTGLVEEVSIQTHDQVRSHAPTAKRGSF